MSEHTDRTPGDDVDDAGHVGAAVRTYLLGLALAVGLTAASFWAIDTKLIYGPSVPIAISVLALAQMGVHLVFFLHITTSPDNTNNVLALAFGVLIVLLVIGGSVWIMANMSYNLMPSDAPMQMQR